MGREDKPVRQIRIEYKPDRLSPKKLSQAYQLLMPDKTWPVGKKNNTAKDKARENETSSNLRQSLLGETKE
jgi:hypothetical protein